MLNLEPVGAITTKPEAHWSQHGLLGRLIAFDKMCSDAVQSNNSLACELPLFIFAHMFNRIWVIMPMILMWFIGYCRYDVMLTSQGFAALGSEIDETLKIRMGFVFMFYFDLILLAMVTSTQVMKYTIKRERPQRKLAVPRLSNLRDKEVGTYSMPSGDTSAAAVFCFINACVMGLPAMYIILPLVALGRVYYQCHWFGDTIIGSFVGTFWGWVGYTQFLMLIPLLQYISGPGTFVPLN